MSATTLPFAGRTGLRRLRPLAVLRGQVPLLRLQQPCPARRRRPGGFRGRARQRSCATWRRARPSAGRDERLLRRRHALPDAPGHGGDDTAGDPRPLDGRGRSLRSRSRPTRRRPRPENFRGYRSAGVNRLSLGVQSLNDVDLSASSAGCTAHRKPWPRSRWRARPSPASPSISSTPAPARPIRAWTRGAAGRDRLCCRPPLALPAHHRGRDALHGAAEGRAAEGPGLRRGARALRRDAGDRHAGRPAGLRNLQPRSAGRREPAQSRLLALRRICRRRPRRAWPPHRGRPERGRRRADRHGLRAQPRTLAGTRRTPTVTASSRTRCSIRPSAATRCW